jgi:hypothetical protein
MPRLIPFRLAAACVLALALSVPSVPSAFAKGVSAELRVVGTGGKVLTEQTVSGKTTTIKTSPKASCFGAGTAGSGANVTIKGATALGLLGQASKTTGSLRPLLVTDAFDFGLGICGVGTSKVSGKASWYLKVNHRGATVSGDAVKLHPGDEVLWDLAPSYPYPNELALDAPERVDAGVPFQVRAFTYDEKGKRKPAAGVKVTGTTGVSAVTAADGRATLSVTAASPQYETLHATHGKDIPAPAAPVFVCVGGSCPAP